MLKIIGAYNEAVVYAKVIEEEAIEQIRVLCDQEYTKDSTIRVMPDVHVGKGCTIGMTMTVTDKIVPNIVGVDIGCGMYTVNLGKADIDFEKLDQIVHTIPHGKNVWMGRQKKFRLADLKCNRALKDTKRLERSLGTLGGGNHFIEINEGKDGTRYLVIHSGSRNLGKQVADYYQNLAVELHQGKDQYYQKRRQLIEAYKEQGKRKDLQNALKELKWEERELFIPKELCYLFGEFKDDYLHDVAICQQFAKESRELMAEIITDQMGLTRFHSFQTIHNYIDTDRMILRKGAISAYQDELLLIPINMRDGSILAVGKGNPEWNYSAPHGAGRVLSRGKAKETLTMEEFTKAMKGIYTTSVKEATLDEAPMAYKSIDDILDVVSEAVDIIEVIKPIYNFKA